MLLDRGTWFSPRPARAAAAARAHRGGPRRSQDRRDRRPAGQPLPGRPVGGAGRPRRRRRPERALGRRRRGAARPRPGRSPQVPAGLRAHAAALPARRATGGWRSCGTPGSAASSPTTWAWARRCRRWRWLRARREVGEPDPRPRSSSSRRPASSANWAREAERFAPDLRVVAVTETERKRGDRPRRRRRRRRRRRHVVRLFRLDDDAYRERAWGGLVLDEAQFVKNHQAKTYQCARRLPRAVQAGDHRHAAGELPDGPVVAALDHGARALPRPDAFTEHYRKPIETRRAPELLDLLRRRIRPADAAPHQGAGRARPAAQAGAGAARSTLTRVHRRIYDRTCSASASGARPARRRGPQPRRDPRAR